MVYSLDVHLVTNNNAVINAVMDQVPTKLDSRVWADRYDLSTGPDIEGNNYIHIMVRFNQDADRSVVWNWMKGKKDQVINKILPGSYIRLHNCFHDETPVKDCIVTDVWSK